MVLRPVKELLESLMSAISGGGGNILSEAARRVVSLVDDIIDAVQHIEEVIVPS